MRTLEGSDRVRNGLMGIIILLINIFVLPIAFGGLLHFPKGSVDADTFVLTLPIAQQQPWLTFFVFIGGLSAATGMVIVETIALSGATLYPCTKMSTGCSPLGSSPTITTRPPRVAPRKALASPR